MKIRTGFVSNSSSTSFLIISKGKLKKKDLRDLMGVGAGSPLAPIFEQLYSDLMNSINVELDLAKCEAKTDWKASFGERGERLSERMIAKLEKSKRKGHVAYYGSLDSESSNVQTFFCMDSFEEENGNLYLNALENAW